MCLKILLCHNYYQQPGGEDHSFAAEASLLESHGHEVVRYTVHNNSIERMSRFEAARRTLWNRETFHGLRELIRRERPAVMHCTNIFPLISPAAYYAAQAEGVTIVQSLRNYRLFCPNGCFFRNGYVCEDCLGRKFPWPGIVHGCYHSSRTTSAVVAGMLSLHWVMRTWIRKVHRYFTPTEFSRQKFLEGGLVEEQVAVKPNFVHPDPGAGEGRGGYAVFVGRLSPEKGVEMLLTAWPQLARRLPLKIIGDGPLAEQVRATANETAGIDWLGLRPSREVMAILGEAACLVMPSIWYETFGRTIIESYSKGTPVVASRLGAMAELVHDGRTGVLFEPGNPEDLTTKIHQLLDDPGMLGKMRRSARREYEEKYTAVTNYRLLMAIYEEAVTGKVSQHAQDIGPKVQA